MSETIIERSDSFKAIAKALLAVQKAVSGVTRDSANPHFKSRYASLENVVAAIRPACLEAGIVVTQAAGAPTERGLVPVETLLIHAETGEWMRSILPLPVTKADAQGVGSAITYACRYSLMAMFNLPPVDDDGNAASARNGNGETAHTNTIRAQQIVELRQAIMDADVNLPTFLKYFGIAKVDDLPGPRFTEAMDMISAKAAKSKKVAA